MEVEYFFSALKSSDTVSQPIELTLLKVVCKNHAAHIILSSNYGSQK